MDESMVDVQKLMSFADDLIVVLKNQKDSGNLTQLLEGAKTLRSLCDKDSNEVHTSLQEYQERIIACKQKISDVENETIADPELEGLEKQLEDEFQQERLLQKELSTESGDELAELERERVRVEERRAATKRSEKDLLRLQNTLSMCASVTNIIPDFSDQTKISGCIVDRNKKKVEKFEFEPSRLSTLEICNKLWSQVQ